MPSLIVHKDNGELLFDTNRICYGLVKSGYLVAGEIWPRKYLRGSNVDPNEGGSYQDSFREGDRMFTISVSNVQSPVVFIVGKGCLQGSWRSGDSITFMYSAVDAGTKAYVFDLMADNLPGSPFLKTYTEQGVCTFNSLQPPLNIEAAIQAPGPGGLDIYGRYPSPHNGGWWEVVRHQQAHLDPQAHFVTNVNLAGGVEYAACLPWSRTCMGHWAPQLTGVNTLAVGMVEGAYGRVGGISFMFAPAGATTQVTSSTAITIPGSVDRLPTDRYPQALVVRTSSLPFPYR